MSSGTEEKFIGKWEHFPAHRLMNQVIFTIGFPENPFITQVMDLRGEARRDAIITADFLPKVLANIVVEFIPLRTEETTYAGLWL